MAGSRVVRALRRIGVTVAGVLVLVAGVVMLALPGPGWLTIVAGLAILATEYLWARRALDATKSRVVNARNRMRARGRRRRDGDTPAGKTGEESR